MTEPTSPPSASDPLDALSHRVSEALNEDARRRRWITRVFVVLAIVPAIAAVLVFALGHSDVEQTRMLVQQETRNIESEVSEKITASVAQELQGAREVAVLLPELKTAAEVAPLVQENHRTLSEYRTVVDSAVERQEVLSHSVELATRDLAKIPSELSGLETRIEEASKRADSAQAQATDALKNVHTSAKVLEERVAKTEGRVAQVGRVEKSVASVQAAMHKTRAELERTVEDRINALARTVSTSGTDTRSLQSIEKKLDALAGQSKRLQTLESHVARLPKQTTNTSALERTVDSLSEQIKSYNNRLAALERGGSSRPADISKEMRSLQARIDGMNRSINRRLSGIEKRLTALERPRRPVIR